MKIMFNGWGCLALFIVCWCINEIIKNISTAIAGIKAIKYVKELSEEQRELLIKQLGKNKGA